MAEAKTNVNECLRNLATQDAVEAASPPTLSRKSIAEDLNIPIRPEPGVAFCHRGQYFYYIAEGRTLVEVTQEACVLLSAVLRGAPYDAAIAELAGIGREVDAAWVRVRMEECKSLQYFAAAPTAEVTSARAERTASALLHHQPMKLMLFVTQTCNLRCRYCYGIEGAYDDRNERMSVEVARAAVDYLLRGSPARDHFSIYFFGGEPLINFVTMRDIVSYARAAVAAQGKTVEFGLTTNGILLSDEVCDFLVAEDFQIALSVDGPSAVHNAQRPTRGGRGSLDAVLRGLARLRSRKLRPRQLKVRATMTHASHDPLVVADFFTSIGLRNFGIGSALPRAGLAGAWDLTGEDLSSLEPRFEIALGRLVETLRARRSTPSYNPFFRGVSGLTRGRSEPGVGCGLCRNDQGIGVDGSIYPCHRFVGLRPYVIGNVTTGVDKECAERIYSGLHARWLASCRDCWARYACSGGCPWQLASDSGEFVAPNEALCESTKRSLQRSAWLSVWLARERPDVLESLARNMVSVEAGGVSTTCSPPMHE